jgi:hypothetical protein
MLPLNTALKQTVTISSTIFQNLSLTSHHLTRSNLLVSFYLLSSTPLCILAEDNGDSVCDYVKNRTATTLILWLTGSQISTKMGREVTNNTTCPPVSQKAVNYTAYESDDCR